MSEEFKEDLFAHLTGETTFSDKFGNRLYPIQAPQNATYPCVVYTVVTNEGDYAHDGPTEIGEKRYQFDVMAEDPLDLERGGDILKSLLSGFKGTMNSRSNVGYIFLDNEIEIRDKELEKYTKSIDFRIRLNNTQ